jgi:PPOX class probable FMN-dependent enzyme
MAPRPPKKEVIESEDALRALLGEPAAVVCAKVSDRLVASTRPFIEQSPLVLLATSDASGACDVSPRGDPPGFVRILDDRTLLLPERPGNRLADSLRNILSNGRVGLLFLIPGVSDTFRVNGRATLTTDPALLAPCAVEGKAPRLGIWVEIEQAFTHCAKAFIRADFWNADAFVRRDSLPTNGAIHKELAELAGGAFDADAYDAERSARYARREGFY